ncbi:Uncharacterized protein PHSC3_000280 [Chlamydiales bacterium STE3]|nr:Uncharacterized protein PHSC3_000280 [Chlamydiales bacterium STE3]
MPDQTNHNPVMTHLVKPVEGHDGGDQNLSLDALILLINTERLKTLKDKTRNELSELRARQEKVRVLHKLLRAINTSTEDNGKIDCSNNQELKNLLKKAKDLGVDLKDDKVKFSREERDRLVENIRITVDDYNVENDMQLQSISRLTNERYESYQMARSILRPLHEDKLRKAREIAGKG